MTEYRFIIYENPLIFAVLFFKKRASPLVTMGFLINFLRKLVFAKLQIINYKNLQI